jgi:hypothetical protein
MTLSIMTLSIMTLSIMTLSIMTLSIKGLLEILSIKALLIATFSINIFINKNLSQYNNIEDNDI